MQLSENGALQRKIRLAEETLVLANAYKDQEVCPEDDAGTVKAKRRAKRMERRVVVQDISHANQLRCAQGAEEPMAFLQVFDEIKTDSRLSGATGSGNTC